MEVKLSNGEVKKYPSGIKAGDIVEDLGPRAMAVFIDGQAVDLEYAIQEGKEVKILSFDEPEGREVFWHSTSHIMAHAVKDFFRQVRLGIGPPIAQGFYYNLERRDPFSSEELVQVEEKMKEIVKADLPIQREEVSKEKALKIFQGEDFKIQLKSNLLRKLRMRR